MRVEVFAPPSNRAGFSTGWIAGTVLFLAAAVATLGISFRDPRVDYGYECIVFGLAVCCRGKSMRPVPGLLLALLSVWGVGQLLTGATVYRYATLQSWLRFTALGATAWVSFQVFGSERLRVEFLRIFAWFGAAIAVISVVAYFTSPGRILWLFEAPYPDVWGSFLSRNNFAQFLELAMPVALWFALGERSGKGLYLCLAAVMLAAGLASASRAGSLILVLEAMAVLGMRWRSRPARRMALGLVLATALFVALPGIGTLIGRLLSPDPYQMRREIAQATIHMIASRPWTGFGLGTFPVVYPEYARFDVGQAVEHAHNDWLEWAAEGGIGFLAVWAGLALWPARLAVRTGWGIGVLGCFLHGLVDYPFARFGVAAWVFILLGMLIATDLREVRPRTH